MRPTLICIGGPDGVGKTTHAKLIVKTLRKKGIPVEYVWIRWEHKLSFFPLALARLLKLRYVVKLKNEKKLVYYYLNRIKPLAIIYQYTFLLDYLLSILLKVKLKLWMGKYVISDRSIYDSLVDLCLFTGNLRIFDTFTAKVLQLSIRKAKVIILTVSLNILRSRREDVRADKDLELKKKLYDNLLIRDPAIIQINASGSVIENHLTLLQLIGTFLNETG